MKSSDAVKSMSVDRRNCIRLDETEESLLENDIKLDVYKTYSRRSCLMECRARNLFDLCGCLPYYFPQFSSFWQKNTDCDLKGLDCLSEELGSTTGPFTISEPQYQDRRTL